MMSRPFRSCGLQGVAKEIEKLIHLRDLDLSENKLSAEDLKAICKLYNLQTLLVSRCELEEIPTEIGNLVQLRHLDLSENGAVKKFPESICYLRELRSLDVNQCCDLSELPQGIHNLVKLDVVNNNGTSLNQYPQGLSQLTGLRELDQFCGGSDWSKFGYLKELNRLSKQLELEIQLANLDEDVVGDAREAELEKKIHLKTLRIFFVVDQRYERDEGEPLCMDVVDALRAHANLQKLSISYFMGSKLPSWIVSPDYHLKEIVFRCINYCLSLPPFGMLQCLEKLSFGYAGLEFLGREFLGITSSSPSSSTNMIVGFPKLKKLVLMFCPKWEEWEDITAEEEDSTILSVMPCLSELKVKYCPNLTVLPHRLLRKATSMKSLVLLGSAGLVSRYRDKERPCTMTRSGQL